MLYNKFLVALAFSTGALGANLALNPANVQSGSQSNGLAANGAEAGQAASATDAANFINFCTGKTLTNGLQVKGGSCNGIVMGNIPASTNMISTIITNPVPGDSGIAPNTDFDVTVQSKNLAAGSFTNPDATYYAAPQDLNGQGIITGHSHVTIETLGNSLTPQTPGNAGSFVFFKGLNAAQLTATVKGGLPAGFYRVCTLTAASNHQPVLMPVAQRGSQDDCTKFTIGKGVAAVGKSAGGASASGISSATTPSSSTAVVAANGAGAAAGNKGAKKGSFKGNKGFGKPHRMGRHRYAERDYVVDVL